MSITVDVEMDAKKVEKKYQHSNCNSDFDLILFQVQNRSVKSN